MKPEEMWQVFQKRELNFFTGVPDSTFKGWMSFLDDHHGKGLTNIIACNECEAISVSAGYHLATGKIGVVYMQNSGFGKTVNPITSLVDPHAYSIPMLLMIGWRGEPGKKDEPQHIKMGRILLDLLKTMEIPYEILPDNSEDFGNVLEKALNSIHKNSEPFALVIPRGIVQGYEKNGEVSKSADELKLTREDAIQIILEQLDGKEVIVSTTGKTSRELFEHRIRRGEKPRDFYTVGSMGCSASIGLGMALNSKSKVIILDGDGAVIMQMGSLSTIGHYHPENLYHIVIDNNAYGSTGGQPTVSDSVDFAKVARANGYNQCFYAKSRDTLVEQLKEFQKSLGPNMLIIHVKKGARKDLGRPTTTPIENKQTFMNFHKSLQN